jgi:hypothetical protein
MHSRLQRLFGTNCGVAPQGGRSHSQLSLGLSRALIEETLYRPTKPTTDDMLMARFREIHSKNKQRLVHALYLLQKFHKVRCCFVATERRDEKELSAAADCTPGGVDSQSGIPNGRQAQFATLVSHIIILGTEKVMDCLGDVRET